MRTDLNPKLALVVILVLWGVAGWLDQPGDATAAAAILRDPSSPLPGTYRSCVPWEAADGTRGFGPSPVVFTIDSNGDPVFDETPATTRRCPAQN